MNRLPYLNCINLIRYSIILLFISSLNSCAPDPSEVLNKKIKKALRNDNVIDKSEWNSFVSYIDNNKKEFDHLETNNVVMELKKLISNIADKRRNQPSPDIYTPNKIKDTITDNTVIKVFIENSGSMDGYVRNTTEFEGALSDLLVQMQYKYSKENLNINFINTKIHPSEVDEVNTFVEKLDPNKAPYKVGQRATSKFNEILETILDSTTQQNISILISDCIYSLDKGKDTSGALELQKSLTKSAFLEKSKVFDFSTLILKMNSKFNGNYYDKNDKITVLNGEYRPYYIWIIGRDKRITSFLKKINLNTLKGFKNSYYLSNTSKKDTPYYSILKETNRIGRFKQTDRKTRIINSINNIEYKDGKFQFSLAIDLSNIPVDQNYLMDDKNYNLPTGFTINAIEKIDQDKIHHRDFVTLEKTSATHFITVSTTSKYTLRDLKLELSNTIPSWVKNSNSLDDTTIKNQLDKTFGLLYLIQGVSEAYEIQNTDSKSHFSINITIKK